MTLDINYLNNPYFMPDFGGLTAFSRWQTSPMYSYNSPLTGSLMPFFTYHVNDMVMPEFALYHESISPGYSSLNGSFFNSVFSYPSLDYNILEGYAASAYQNFYPTMPSYNYSINPFDAIGCGYGTSPYPSSRRSERVVTKNPHLGPEFLKEVKAIAGRLNCNYKDLLAIMNVESSLKADNWNGTNAVGLIQFTDLAISDLNTKYNLNLTKEKISKMSALEQLQYVEKYFNMTKQYRLKDKTRLTGEDLYALVLLPRRADREVLTSNPESYYKSNRKVLDINFDGKITKTDLREKLKRFYVNESIFT